MKTNFDSDNILVIAKQFEHKLSVDQLCFIDSHLLEELIQYYLDRDQLELAGKACDMGISIYQFSGQFFRLKATTLLASDNFLDALELVEKACQIDGVLIENLTLKAEILIRSDKLTEAENLLKKAIPVFGPDSVELLLTKLSIFEKKRQYLNAFLTLKEYLLANSHQEHLLERAYFYMEMAQCYKDGIRLYKYLIENDPYSHLAWYNLGTCYFNLDQFDSAVEAFEFVMVIDPSFKMGYIDCAEAYFNVGIYEKTIQIYEEGLEQFELTSEIAVNLGLSHDKLDDSKNALAYFLRALKIDPLNDQAHHQLGLFYLRQDKLKAAKSSLVRAIELNDLESDYYASLAVTYSILEELESARDYFEKACDLAPDECDKWIQYAIFLLDTDLPESALDVIEQAYMYCPTMKINFCKTACLFVLGRRKEALLLLKEALVICPKYAGVLYDCQPALKDDTEVALTVLEFNA